MRIAFAHTERFGKGGVANVEKRNQSDQAMNDDMVLVPTPRKHPLFLKEWREHAGMSQAALARAIGTVSSRINEVENGRDRYNETLLNRIADALSVEPWCLLMGPPEIVMPLRAGFMRLSPSRRADALRLISALGPANED